MTALQYDVFVSYSPADQEWVERELLSRLERANIRYIDHLRFTVGRPKLDEIERAVGESHWTLLVLTESYLQDHWRRFDSILAGSYGLDAGEWRAIPLLKGHCELPPRLRALVPVDVRAGDQDEWERLLHTLSSSALPVRPLTGRPSLFDLRGAFALPGLIQQGLIRCLGWGQARQVIPLEDEKVIVIALSGAGLIDVQRGQALWRIDCPAQCGAISPDRTLLALGGEAIIYLWDLRTGQLYRSLSAGTGVVKHQRADFSWVPIIDRQRLARYVGIINSVAFAPGGDMLAAGFADNNVRLWRVSDGALVQTLEGHTSPVTSVAFAPHGNILASGADDHTVRLWRTSDGTLLHTLKHKRWLKSQRVKNVAFAPDGTTLVVGLDDNTLRLWRTADGHALYTLEGHQAPVTSIAFPPQELHFASASMDKTIRVWRVSDGGLIRTLGESPDALQDVAFISHGDSLAAVTEDTALLWRNFKPTHRYTLDGCRGAVRDIAFTPDGKALAAATGLAVLLWSILDGHLQHTLQGHSGPVSSVAFSPDGKVLATGSFDQTARLWKFADGRLLHTLQGHSNSVTSVAFALDGSIVASGSGGTVRLWRVKDGVLRHTLGENTGAMTSVAFAPDRNTLVSGAGSTIRRWQIADGSSLGTYPVLISDNVIKIALAPDGNTLASATARSVHVWDVRNERNLCSVENPGGDLTGLAFSPDGNTLATASTDGVVRRFRVSDGDPQGTIRGHTSPVWSLAFSPDGRWLATGGRDGTVRLWETD